MVRRVVVGVLGVSLVLTGLALTPASPLVSADEAGEAGGSVSADFRCAGDPPRQTEDPASPPCVPTYTGPNAGATAPGVTATEIRVVVYLDGNLIYTEGSDPQNRATPRSAIYDLAQSEEACKSARRDDLGCEHLTVRGLRVWQEYFNRRFQTYDRSLRFFVQFSSGGDADEWSRRDDAVLAHEVVTPFAVVSLTWAPEARAYLEKMGDLGVVAFGHDANSSTATMQALAGRLWTWMPSPAEQARTFSAYVCQQVIGPDPQNPRPATLAGPILQGRPRTLGLIRTTDPERPDLVELADETVALVEGCGGSIADEAAVADCCWGHDGSDLPTDELEVMARFQAQGITTILWPGGISANYPRAAALRGYAPEWVLAGAGDLDNPNAIHFAAASPAFHGHAVVVTPGVLTPDGEVPRCERFFREIDGTTPDRDLDYVCGWYRPLFLAAVAVQVAGPDLTVAALTAGLQAIPRVALGDPSVQSGSFTATDFSWTDDAQVERWDGLTIGDPTDRRTLGCWRAVDGGARHVADGWPDENVDARFSPADPCNADDWSTRVRIF